MTTNKQNLIWIDLEMTGLDPEQNRIIELATVVTDKDLNVIAEGPCFAIHQDNGQLAAMDEWNSSHHNESGLVKRVQASQVTENQAETETIAFLRKHVPERSSPMCGNSNYLDRIFLRRYMPQLEQFFHYRHIDVTSLKILAQLWSPGVAKQLTKRSNHLALDDIYDSINELRFYRQHLLNIEQ